MPSPDFQKLNLASAAISVPQVAERLLSQISKPENLVAYKVDELFKFSDRCVAEGLYTERDSIFKAIKSHPEVGAEDLKRIDINSLMGERRRGNFEHAIQSLLNIEAAKDVNVETIRLQEIQLAGLSLWHRHKSDSDQGLAQDYRSKSLEAGEKLINHPDFSKLPANRQALYLQARSATLVTYGLLGDEFSKLMDRYEKLIPALTEPDKSHHSSEIAHNRGLHFQQENNYEQAAKSFIFSHDSAISTYSKFSGALNALALKELAPGHSDRFPELKEFILREYQNLGGDQKSQFEHLLKQLASKDTDYQKLLEI